MYDNIFYCKCRAAKASVLYEHLLFHDCQILIIKKSAHGNKVVGFGLCPNEEGL